MWTELSKIISIYGNDQSRESGGLFSVGAFVTNLASDAVKMFSYLIYMKRKFYTYFIFFAIRTDNASTQISLFLSTFERHTVLLV